MTHALRQETAHDGQIACQRRCGHSALVVQEPLVRSHHLVDRVRLRRQKWDEVPHPQELEELLLASRVATPATTVTLRIELPQLLPVQRG